MQQQQQQKQLCEQGKKIKYKCCKVKHLNMEVLGDRFSSGDSLKWARKEVVAMYFSLSQRLLLWVVSSKIEIRRIVCSRRNERSFFHELYSFNFSYKNHHFKSPESHTRS